MLHSTLTSKGQTTIPAEIREKLEMKPGDRLLYELQGDKIVVRVHPGVKAVFGMLKGKGKRLPGGFEQERAVARQAWAERAARRAGL